jgi:hypothetical protein
MNSSQELYNRLNATLRTYVSVSNSKQVTNWIWIIVGILQSHSLALSRLATHLPLATEAESRVTLIRRWLKNFHIEVWTFYRAVLAQVFQGWQAVDAYVILDGVMVFGDRWQIFRLSLAHGCRAIPLGWVVLEGTGVTQVEKLETLLTQVAEFLRMRVGRVTFLADRGFRDCDWAKLCGKIGWHYAIRVARNTYITLPDGRYGRLDDFVPWSQNRYFQNIWLTQEAKLQTNLSVTWTAGTDQTLEIVAVISDRPACRQRLREYGWRMRVEQSFRDDKSGGFEMAHTRLQHADRLERLLLALAIATLWCHELGERVLTDGEDARRQIDPGPHRELSLFQLGWRWLQRCLSVAIHDLPVFAARLTNLKLKPVVYVPDS